MSAKLLLIQRVFILKKYSNGVIFVNVIQLLRCSFAFEVCPNKFCRDIGYNSKDINKENYSSRKTLALTSLLRRLDSARGLVFLYDYPTTT